MSLTILVVDDSFTMRTLVTDLLISDPDISVVETAKSGPEAIQKLSRVRFDGMTLDLILPGEDGVSLLKTVMRKYPLPVIVLSALSQKDAAITFECLAAGAVGFIPKPSGELSLDIEKIGLQLRTMVKAAAQVPRKKFSLPKPATFKLSRRPRTGSKRMIVIGASTGGPQTLESILTSLPADFPAPVLVVQHMPSLPFTKQLAERLDRNCPLVVKVAQNQDLLEAGAVYLAPSGFQSALKKQDRDSDLTEVRIALSPDESGDLTPSIDAAMKSAADVYREGAIGIILSGMGQDGTEGMRAIKARGGLTIAEDESAILFGMPRSVIEAGLADQTLPAEKILQALGELVSQRWQ